MIMTQTQKTSSQLNYNTILNDMGEGVFLRHPVTKDGNHYSQQTACNMGVPGILVSTHHVTCQDGNHVERQTVVTQFSAHNPNGIIIADSEKSKSLSTYIDLIESYRDTEVTRKVLRTETTLLTSTHSGDDALSVYVQDALVNLRPLHKVPDSKVSDTLKHIM
jgi:hypothetical protein